LRGYLIYGIFTGYSCLWKEPFSQRFINYFLGYNFFHSLLKDAKIMDKKITLIKSICEELVKKDKSAKEKENSAKEILSDWKFQPSSQKNKKNIPIPDELAVFHRDHFICRYCGKHTHIKVIGNGKRHILHITN